MIYQAPVIVEAGRGSGQSIDLGRRRGFDLLLVSNPIPSTNETFLMMFAHMCEELVVAKETLPTKLAQRVNATLYLILGHRFP